MPFRIVSGNERNSAMVIDKGNIQYAVCCHTSIPGRPLTPSYLETGVIMRGKCRAYQGKGISCLRPPSLHNTCEQVGPGGAL